MMGNEDHKTLDAAQGSAAARLFLSQMIAHHEGAVMTAETQISQGRSPDAVNLSTRNRLGPAWAQEGSAAPASGRNPRAGSFHPVQSRIRTVGRPR